MPSNNVERYNVYYDDARGFFTDYSRINGPMRNIGCLAPSNSLTTGGALTGGFTHRIATTVPGSFSAVRCHLLNAATTPVSGIKAAVSVSESFVNTCRPTIGGIVDETKWINFTFSGAATGTKPGSAALTPSTNPGRLISDWATITPVSRTDGGTLPIIYFAQLIPDNTAIGYNSSLAGSMTLFNALPGNQMPVYNYTNQVDALTDPTLFGVVGLRTTFNIPFSLEFMFDRPQFTLWVFGDSTTEGARWTPTTFLAPSRVAQANLSASGKLFLIENESESGTNSDSFWAKFQQMIATGYIPSAIYYQGWSVNDSGGYYSITGISQFNKVIKVLDWCERNNVQLITSTPQPYVAAGGTAPNAGIVAGYYDVRSRLLGIKSANYTCLDYHELHDQTKIGVWDSRYGYDAYHPNGVGIQFKANALSSVLMGMI